MDRIQATVLWQEGMAFKGQTESGHSVQMDAAPEVGGANRGARPMELLLTALGGCTGMDVISILRKMRQQITSYEVRVAGSRAGDHPRVFQEITVEHVVRGRDLAEDMVARAVKLSETRYCPISAMLGKSVRLVHTYRIEET